MEYKTSLASVVVNDLELPVVELNDLIKDWKLDFCVALVSESGPRVLALLAMLSESEPESAELANISMMDL